MYVHLDASLKSFTASVFLIDKEKRKFCFIVAHLPGKVYEVNYERSGKFYKNKLFAPTTHTMYVDKIGYPPP